MYFSNDVFGCNLSNVNPLKCLSINNQECNVSPEIVNVNSDEPVFFFLLLLKEVNTVVVAIIRMQNCAPLML